MEKAMKCLMAAMVLSLLASSALIAGDWVPIYEGVWYQTAAKSSPRPMKAYALKIDLKNPAVSFLATPSNGGSPYETNLQTTPAFRSAYGLEAAINANFFISYSPYADNRGALVSNGTLVSSHESAYPTQLRIDSSKVASIVSASGNPSGMHTVVSGDAYHLVGGVCLGANDIARARTSVGLSQDRRFLIMCVVDEKQSDSQGATILDMSYWMKDFGAWDAMNLDGGGSSCICTASGGVLNHPSEGSPRAVGANLGVNTSADVSRVDVFWQGTDNQYHTMHWSSGTGWSSTSGLGRPTSSLASDLSAVSEAPGCIDVYCRGTDNKVYRRYYRNGAWSASWSSLGGNIVGSPDACSWGPNHQDIYARNANNHLVHNSWNGSAWSGWQEFTDGVITSDPAVVCRKPGCVDVFARGANGDLVYKSYNGSWSGWQSLGGGIVGGPDACSWSADRIDVFARGTNNALYQISWINGSGWSGWANKGGTLYSDPGCASRDPNILDVFVQGGSNSLYKISYTPSTGWTSWQNLLSGVIGSPDACSWTNDAGTHQ